MRALHELYTFNREILSDENGLISCKRWVGSRGMIVIFICYMYCCFTHTEVPEITEFLAGCCVVLLGADTAKNTITKFSKNNSDDSDNESEQSTDK